MYNINQGQCKKVADCVEACPMGAIEKKGDGTFNVSDDCTDCGACEPVCDAKAIQLAP
jgi:NAD-dependent dihydropyrimidine dehydrogenase PreA subunit